MLYILRIFDFDKTISIEHTVHEPAQYQPDSNTKSGLQKIIAHNDLEACAVATFHKDPEYILTYLLPLLGLSENDVIQRQTKTYAHHQLLKLYLKNCKYPLIISTPLTDDYRKHLSSLAWNGKNTQINDIISELPGCDEYHFYDDSEKNYSSATCLGTLHCHWVEEDSTEFATQKTQKPTALGELKNILKAYLDRSQENKPEEERITQPLNALSLFASSSNNYNHQKEEEEEVETQSLTNNPQIAAAALLKFLDFGPAPDKATLTQLQGSLANVIADWEHKTSCLLSDFIANLEQERAETEAAVDYVSDDENYEIFPGNKI